MAEAHRGEVYISSFAEVAKPWQHTTAVHLPLVVRTDTVTRQEADQANCHADFFALYIVRQGRGIHVVDGVPYGVARGDVYVMGVGMMHWYSRYDDLVLDAFYFQPDLFDLPTIEALSETPGMLPLFLTPNPLPPALPSPSSILPASASDVPSIGEGGGGRWLHLSPDAHLGIETEIVELRAEWQRRDRGSDLLTRVLFIRLLVHLARRRAESNTLATRAADTRSVSRNAPPAFLPVSPPISLTNETTMAAAVRYIDSHYMEPLRIEQVAALVFLSPDRFTEVFTASMGRTPRDYLRHLRIERARSLLTQTDAPISEVGAQVGFLEAAYFTRVFRAATGTTPLAYRRQRSTQIEAK